MDNYLTDLTTEEFQSLYRLWGLILQNRALFEATPDAWHYYHAFAKERQNRAPVQEYKPLRYPSGRGGNLALHRACGDAGYGHSYEFGRGS